MPMLKIISFIIAFLALLAGMRETASPETYRGIRCGGSLIDIGMSDYEVWQKCGQPAEIRNITVITIRHGRLITDYYNGFLNPIYDSFISTQTVNGYGGSPADICASHDYLMSLYSSAGYSNSSYNGMAMTIKREIALPAYPYPNGPFIWQCSSVTVNVEKYIYNPGRTGLLRFFTFENGTLVRIETGNYGF
jgi:hypothetical protein